MNSVQAPQLHLRRFADHRIHMNWIKNFDRENLIKEGKDVDKIWVTGNTVIDALKTTVRKDYKHPELEWTQKSRLIFITAHRRENLGQPMHQMFRAVRRVLHEHKDVKVLYPIHMNPVVREAAFLYISVYPLSRISVILLQAFPSP